MLLFLLLLVVWGWRTDSHSRPPHTSLESSLTGLKYVDMLGHSPGLHRSFGAASRPDGQRCILRPCLRGVGVLVQGASTVAYGSHPPATDERSYGANHPSRNFIRRGGGENHSRRSAARVRSAASGLSHHGRMAPECAGTLARIH